MLCYFGTNFLERSAERALNLGITGAFWDMFGSLRSSASCESGFHKIAPRKRILDLSLLRTMNGARDQADY